jgi:hypothetical protein
MLARCNARTAVNDLLGLSSAVALLVDGAECRLRQQQLAEALTDEQTERLRDLFAKLRYVAEDVADCARELAEQSRDASHAVGKS